jgi:hypothetical protein
MENNDSTNNECVYALQYCVINAGYMHFIVGDSTFGRNWLEISGT